MIISRRPVSICSYFNPVSTNSSITSHQSAGQNLFSSAGEPELRGWRPLEWNKWFYNHICLIWMFWNNILARFDILHLFHSRALRAPGGCFPGLTTHDHDVGRCHLLCLDTQTILFVYLNGNKKVSLHLLISTTSWWKSLRPSVGFLGCETLPKDPERGLDSTFTKNQGRL